MLIPIRKHYNAAYNFIQISILPINSLFLQKKEMKQTPFTEKHLALGAKMAEFAGYNMPISYTGINDEHAAVRNNAGVFDVSHMGEVLVTGKNALDFLQSITTNDLSKISEGKAQYSCFTNEQGGIIDDLIIYCLKDNDTYMIVLNASNIAKDLDWMRKHNNTDALINDISDKTGLLAVQGPNATKILQPLTELDILNLRYYTFVKGEFAGVDDVLISATGYTGSGGVEIYFEDKDDNAEKIWNAIFEAGASKNLKPIGLGARDTLRLEMGYCLYGNDIDDSTTPLEAGLGWITKFNKSTGFTAKEILQKQKEEGIKRKLIGFEMVEKGIPRQHYKIVDGSDNEIGEVTSGTQSPSLQKAIGLGYVNVDHAAAGTDIYISIRQKPVLARVVKTPFA